MYLKLIEKKYSFSPYFLLNFSKKLSCIFIESFSGIFVLRLPSFFFFKFDILSENLTLLFLKNFFFKSFFNHLLNFSSRLSVIFFIKLRLSGLGYRIRSINNMIYYFFFNRTNYYYLFVPKTLLLRSYKKRILLISFDWFLLKLVLCHILLLKKIGPYKFLGVRVPRQIVFLKKSGKKI